ncbi:MAG: hypothetical protein FVQ80_14000 [Planctomycetes bacterium]|nr:hypothetical protein [Planctomycetota bacterium]
MALICCCSCGRRIQKAQLKWAIVERLTRNPELSLRKRPEIIRSLFPEDDFDSHAKRDIPGWEKPGRKYGRPKKGRED